MRHQKIHTKIFLLFFTLLGSLTVGTVYAISSDIDQFKMNFWSTQKRGANIFNRTIAAEDIRAAKEYGIEFIRLAPDKFFSSYRDFLLGNADDYCGLIEEDLKKLRQTLDLFHKEGMPVVITILNEPHPERMFNSFGVDISTVNQSEVQAILHDFYAQIVKSIRLGDPYTPIVLDSSAYADPRTFTFLKPHEDSNILYSFHFYEPYEYTNYQMNQGNYSYPGNINGKGWDRKEIRKCIDSVIEFQKINNISSNRILVGEFGCYRMSAGVDIYFQDLISIFEKEEWHFAFYAFREDIWHGMDYELGSEKVPLNYWQKIENNEQVILNRKDTYPAFSILTRNFNK